MAVRVKDEISEIERACRVLDEHLETLRNDIIRFNVNSRFSSSEWSGIAADQYQESINNLIDYINNAYRSAKMCNETLKNHMSNYRKIDRLG